MIDLIFCSNAKSTYVSFLLSIYSLCYVAGREGHFLEPMSYIHVRRSTPGPAVAMQGLVSFLFICVGDIEALIEFASFLIWVMYGAAFACLIVLRRTQPNTHRPYKVPIVIPIFTLLVAIFLSVMPIITEPSLKYLAALAFIFSGVLIYIPFVYYRIRPRFMGKKDIFEFLVFTIFFNHLVFFRIADKFTFLIQVLFEVAPAQDLKET